MMLMPKDDDHGHAPDRLRVLSRGATPFPGARAPVRAGRAGCERFEREVGERTHPESSLLVPRAPQERTCDPAGCA